MIVDPFEGAIVCVCQDSFLPVEVIRFYLYDFVLFVCLTYIPFLDHFFFGEQKHGWLLLKSFFLFFFGPCMHREIKIMYVVRDVSLVDDDFQCEERKSSAPTQSILLMKGKAKASMVLPIWWQKQTQHTCLVSFHWFIEQHHDVSTQVPLHSADDEMTVSVPPLSTVRKRLKRIWNAGVLLL